MKPKPGKIDASMRRGISIKGRVRSGTLPYPFAFGCHKWKLNDDLERQCKFCKSGENETWNHVMRCARWKKQREEFFQDLEAIASDEEHDNLELKKRLKKMKQTASGSFDEVSADVLISLVFNEGAKFMNYGEIGVEPPGGSNRKSAEIQSHFRGNAGCDREVSGKDGWPADG